ncbi:FtsX-like permease family protein [[Pseudomonas] boreopolis]
MALAVATMALGLAAAMTMLTLLSMLSSDPLPGLSQRLYLAWADSRQAQRSERLDGAGRRPPTVSVVVLLVTAIGIASLTVYWVEQRTRQIGIRRALGATRGQILRHFLLENLLVAGTGVLLGLPLAVLANNALMSYYELPRLPWTWLPVGAGVLLALGQCAVLWPARRAAALPPAVATRGA